MTDQPSSHSAGLTENEIHRVIGSDGIGLLVQEFYRQVPFDDILGPMYPADDLQGAEDRLRLFLIFRFGGPQDYLQHRGHPKLRIRHAPFAIDVRARDRWVSLMENALSKCQFPPNVAHAIRKFLSSVASFLINR